MTDTQRANLLTLTVINLGLSIALFWVVVL